MNKFTVALLRALYFLIVVLGTGWNSFLVTIFLLNLAPIGKTCAVFAIYIIGVIAAHVAMFISSFSGAFRIIKGYSGFFTGLTLLYNLGWLGFGLTYHYLGLFNCGLMSVYYPYIETSFVTLSINVLSAFTLLKVGNAIIRYDQRKDAEEREARQRATQQTSAQTMPQQQTFRRWRYEVPPTFSWNRATTERHYEMDDMDSLVGNAGTDTLRSVKTEGDAV